MHWRGNVPVTKTPHQHTLLGIIVVMHWRGYFLVTMVAYTILHNETNRNETNRKFIDH